MIHVRVVFLESIPSALPSTLDLLNVLGMHLPATAARRKSSSCLHCTLEECMNPSEGVWIPSCFRKLNTCHHFIPSLLH